MLNIIEGKKLFYLRINPFFKESLGLIPKEFFPVRNAVPFTSEITASYFPKVVISLILTEKVEPMILSMVMDSSILISPRA